VQVALGGEWGGTQRHWEGGGKVLGFEGEDVVAIGVGVQEGGGGGVGAD